MYKETKISEREQLINKARNLLSNTDNLYIAMSRVTKEWPIAAMVNLTNIERNRRAWMGQSACCLVCDTPEDLTRESWMLLTEDERRKANKVADIVITEWTTSHLKEYYAKEVFRQGRLQFGD